MSGERFGESASQSLPDTSDDEAVGGSGFDSALAVIGVTAPVVAGWPGVAAAAATVAFQGVFNRRRSDRMAETIEELEDQISVIKERIDQDRLHRRRHQDLVESALDSAASAKHAEKRSYYVHLIARSSMVGAPTEPESEILLDTLDRLTYAQLALLAAVDREHGPENVSDYVKPGTDAYRVLREALPDLDDSYITRAWRDLASIGLLKEYEQRIVQETSPEDDSPGALTRFGRVFVESLSKSPSS